MVWFFYFCLLELAEDKLELITLEDVAVGTAALARARRDPGVQATGGKLLGDGRVDDGSGGLALVALVADLGGDLLGLVVLPEGNAVVGLVVLAERGSVNLHNSRLDERLCPDQLVRGGVVDHIENTGLARDSLRRPRKVTGIQAESTVLVVTATDTHVVNPLVPTSSEKLGVGSGPTHLKLALKTPRGTLATGVPPLVPRVTRDSLIIHTPER